MIKLYNRSPSHIIVNGNVLMYWYETKEFDENGKDKDTVKKLIKKWYIAKVKTKKKVTKDKSKDK